MSASAFTIIINSAPYSSSQFKEGLDIVLAASAFERSTNLILEDDACYALLTQQNARQIQQKNIEQVMKALPIYGVEKILVCEQSLKGRNLDIQDPPVQIKPINKSDIAKIIRSSNTVIRF